MTNMTSPSPVEIVEQIFVDMGIGPHEAMSMAGAFATRATIAGLRLGTHRSVPPTRELEEGQLIWNGGEKRPPVSAEAGAVLVHYITPLPGPWAIKLTPGGARVTAAHLRAAADAADRQAASMTVSSTEEQQ